MFLEISYLNSETRNLKELVRWCFLESGREVRRPRTKDGSQTRVECRERLEVIRPTEENVDSNDKTNKEKRECSVQTLEWKK